MTGDSNQGVPKLAPAPPPPLEDALQTAGRNSGHAPPSTRGFRPHQGRAFGEVVALSAVLIAIGALIYHFAGTLSAWATPLVPHSVDRKLGEVSAAQLGLMQATCSERATAYVKSITDPLLAAAGPLPFEFQVVVAKDEAVNAFALPGGFLTVNSGLLEAAESGEEVAGVLGHEIQHALLRHGTKRILRQLGGSVAMGLLLGGEPTGMSGLAGRLTSLAYDRDQESEADARGIDLLVRAGVDPSGLGRFFERLAKEGGPAPPALLSTHPDPGERAALAARARPSGALRALPKPPRPVCDP